MPVPFKSQDLTPPAVKQNLINKGFTEDHPTPGCTYVVLPPEEYQELFQGLQNALTEAKTPTANVRIPHATVISAKVIDQRPSDSWTDLEEVQRVYRAFFLHQVQSTLDREHCGYREATMTALTECEKILAAISSKLTRQDALSAIPDATIRAEIDKAQNLCKYREIKGMALEEINKASFQLKIEEVKLTNNGSIIFQLGADDKLLHMRVDLILAGQGIAKWPVLSGMKNAWSTVAYTTKILDENEKAHLEEVIGKWVKENQATLQRAAVDFNTERLGSLAFRSNDFYSVKNATFPVADPTTHKLSEENLRMSPKAGRKINPTAGQRAAPTFNDGLWATPINQKVAGNYTKKPKAKLPITL